MFYNSSNLELATVNKHINTMTRLKGTKSGRVTKKRRRKCRVGIEKEQGRIHGNLVADGWAGAVILKPHAFQRYFGRTDGPMDRPTRQGVMSRVRD